MNKIYYDICYKLLSHYLRFLDVADTNNSINNGLNYLWNFPQNERDFLAKKKEIVSYIKMVRINNIIDAYKDSSNILLFVPVPSGKSLDDVNPQELYNNLAREIPRLILKGIHQAAKHLNEHVDDNQLTAELLQQDIRVLEKYGLLGAEEAKFFG